MALVAARRQPLAVAARLARDLQPQPSRSLAAQRRCARPVEATASGPPIAVSGWDVALGGPKPVRFAVPAGSVYYVQGQIDAGTGQSLCDGPAGDPKEQSEHLAQGWGFALQGAWK